MSWPRQADKKAKIFVILDTNLSQFPAVHLLHLWRSRVYNESPKYQKGNRQDCACESKTTKKVSRTIIQELKLPSLTCQNIILPFNQMEKQAGLPQVGGLFLHVIGLREN